MALRVQRRAAPVHTASSHSFLGELSDEGKRLVNKWKDGYDWRAHERELK